MKTIFELEQTVAGHIDYVTYLDLPPLANGDCRSISLRLTLDEEKNHAYTTLTYEVEGEQAELASNELFTRKLWEEITGAPTQQQTLEAQNAELIATLQGAVETADGEGLQDAWWYAEARAAIAKATKH